MNGVFITGTSTGVGKTWIGSQLVAYLTKQGVKVTPQKPLESGCTLIGEKLIAEDANAYFKACKGSIKLDEITPFTFTHVCSPARAIGLNKSTINLKTIIEHINSTVSDRSIAVIEGAGGIYSPLTTDALNIDLASQLKLPIILIAEDSLGCINAILLSLAAIKQAKLSCIAVVLNETSEQKKSDTNNSHELKQYVQIPIISNHFNKNTAIAKLAALITN